MTHWTRGWSSHWIGSGLEEKIGWMRMVRVEGGGRREGGREGGDSLDEGLE